MLFAISATASLSIWLYLTFGHGKFWRIRPALSAPEPNSKPKVIAIVPARDEADVIGASVTSLLKQQLPEPLEVIVVDDNSSDGTAAIAMKSAARLGSTDRLTVIAGSPLEAGWTGKLWALQQGVAMAQRRNPDYVLFTDADIWHAPDSIRKLLNLAEASELDLASYMVQLATDTLAEKLLIPAFVYFFFQLYPPAWIAEPLHSTAGAAGGCLLVRYESFQRSGGLKPLRQALIDDCAIAAQVKAKGGKLWLQTTRSSGSLRSYGSFSGVGRMISRSAFYQLNHSYLLLSGTVAGLVLTYFIPPVASFSRRRWTAYTGRASWLLMALTYVPITRLYRRPLWQTATLPLAAAFYLAATLHSAAEYARGRGGIWKGRSQDLQL